MYAKILHDIQQTYYQDNYANDGQRFVAWYLRNIHGLNTVEAKDCITDGAKILPSISFRESLCLVSI